MKKYELMVIINPNLGSDAVNKRIDTIKKLVTSQKGEIVFEDLWGVRDLSYTMKKHDTGYYAIFNFTFEGESLEEIDTTLRLENEVLRHMIVKLPTVYKPKTLSELEKEEVEVEEKDKKEKKAAPKKKEEAPKKEEPVKTPKAEKPEPVKEEPKKEDGPSLEDVDEKLKNIIDNPDLNF